MSQEFLEQVLKNIHIALNDDCQPKIPRTVLHISSPQSASLYLGAVENASGDPEFVSLPANTGDPTSIQWTFTYTGGFRGTFVTSDGQYHWHYDASNNHVKLLPTNNDPDFAQDPANLFLAEGSTNPYAIKPHLNQSSFLVYNPTSTLPHLPLSTSQHSYTEFTITTPNKEPPGITPP